jgi:hypothetical protein
MTNRNILEDKSICNTCSLLVEKLSDAAHEGANLSQLLANLVQKGQNREAMTKAVHDCRLARVRWAAVKDILDTHRVSHNGEQGGNLATTLQAAAADSEFVMTGKEK